jgi:membrane-associated phospholipid phosphatase
MLFAGTAALLFVILWALLYSARPLLHPILPVLAHRTAKLRYRDFLPVVALLLAGGILAGMAGDGFLDLAESVYQHNPKLALVDAQIHDLAHTTRTPGATSFFLTATFFGDPLTLGAVVLGAAIYLAIKRRWRWLAYLAVTTGGGALLNLELKRFFSRARPDLAEALRHAHGYSFPSGHAMGSTIVLGALAYLAVRSTPTWGARTAVIALAVTLALSVAASRVYLGVHWVSDVGAGLTAGILWLSVTTVAYETFRRIRRVRELRARRLNTA